MTFQRGERSVLTTPGSNPRMIAKALASDADFVMIDLEDAVAAPAKPAARQIVAEALRDGDWRGRPRAFRVNGLDTPWFVHDLVSVIDGAEGRVDVVVVPKVADRAAARTVGAVLGSLELAAGSAHQIGIEAQVESAVGLTNCEAIAATERVEALVFGPGDFAATIGMPLAAIGMPDRWDVASPGLRWIYPMQRIVVAARAAGIRAIDGPYADYRDHDGFRRSCLMARSLGYDGKWCIHPDQVPIANDIFSPDEKELEWARSVLAAGANAEHDGQGAFALHGQMADAATLRMARATLARARLHAGAVESSG